MKGTINYRLEYDREKNISIKFYSDADWVNESDRHSITGTCVKFPSGLISWFSKKQKTIALSITEAEYMALSFTSQEALWISQLAKDIDNEMTTPTKIVCDNMGTIHLFKNNMTSAKSKHIDVRHHFIRELQETDHP